LRERASRWKQAIDQADGRISGQVRPQEPVQDRFEFTYSAAQREETWLRESLGSFHEDSWIADILRSVKSGKEATVYCCAAHPSVGVDLLAAKVYRPQVFRLMENDAMYREGRWLLDDHGKPVRDKRALRAVKRKTRFGRRVQISSWIEYEYQTLCLLYNAGADVPRPYAQVGHAILMEYLGDASLPAPVLQRVQLARGEAMPLYERLMWNVELMLACDRVHADLSPYNVLYWQGQAKIIDFPQSVDALNNPNAFVLLQRDIERLGRYFQRYGIQVQPQALASDLWERYIHRWL
jgi:RIO kinase 1